MGHDTAGYRQEDGGQGRRGEQGEPGLAAAPARPQLGAPGWGYDPFSYGVDNTEMARLSCMAMARCFIDIRLPPERHTRHLLLRGG